MRRSNFYVKLITVVFFIAVLCYIGVYIYNAALNSYETAVAIPYTVEKTVHTQGYVVRTEIVLDDSGHVVLPVVREGEKVASGQTIAVEYMSVDALEVASEIRELRLMIAQLESSGGSAAAEASRLERIIDLSKAVQHSDFSRLDELAMNIETEIFTEHTESFSDLPALRARLDALEARKTGVNFIYAPVSGVFSQVSDGYEAVAPDAVFDITPTMLDELFSRPSRVSGTGKLVTEFKWYYAAIFDYSDAARLSEGSLITVQFSGAYSSSMDMTVERVCRRDGDECVVLFSSSQGVHELAPFRRLKADVVFEIITGLRVPVEAIQLDDDGTTFVYLQTGVRAERVDVEILVETGDSYLVTDGLEAGTPLRAGSTIIVRANGLFDGKIVG